MMLFGLLLWQNPVAAVEDWLWLFIPGVITSGDAGAWRWVRLSGDLCQFTGMQVHSRHKPYGLNARLGWSGGPRRLKGFRVVGVG